MQGMGTKKAPAPLTLHSVPNFPDKEIYEARTSGKAILKSRESEFSSSPVFSSYGWYQSLPGLGEAQAGKRK
ncbi:hypothetical protein N7520_004505 [Penicillium odoratum]|uniref:uncharacterized protein n=1 Tax=Penicillium odoratum TaxID=1167516 RepID=UPI002548E49A|nr:uncharacterized protein N7520_004505 [Penicillium odoratum]KAJ5764946.1 hypothetical protein N7520_004505 [Penicillium odoratum]